MTNVLQQAWASWVGKRSDLLDTRHNENIFKAGFEAALAQQGEGPDCRIELVTAIHGLASDFENRLGRLDPDDRKLAEGDIAHAMKVASKWNWNGTGAAPAAQQARDTCQVCNGKRGGVPGNENIINGVVICDYCHAASPAAQPDKNELKQLVIRYGLECMANHGTGPSVQAAWQDFIIALG